MNKLVICLLAILVAGGTVFLSGAPIPTNKPAAYPSWWFSSEVVKRKEPPSNTPVWPTDYPAADDYAAVNAGQLKSIATKAYAEFQAHLPGGLGNMQAPNGTGYLLTQLVNGWQNSVVTADDYAAINMGQLKAVGSLFYRRLREVGYTDRLPWSTGAEDDYAVANLGQLKNVFSFDVSTDSDGNGLPDWWELKYFGETGVNKFGLDLRGDGHNILYCFNNGLNPVDFYSGQQVVMTVVSGDNQKALPWTLLPKPIVVAVTKADGTPWVGAPVTFGTDGNFGGYAGSLTPPINIYQNLTVYTDNNGRASVYFAPTVSETGSGFAETSAYKVEFTITGTASASAPTVAPVLQATPVSPTQTILSWSTSATNATATVIQRWTYATGWVTLPAVAAGTTSFNDTAVPAGVVVAYRAASTNAQGSSPYSLLQSADGADLFTRDSDTDGLMDAEEIAIGSNPNDNDTDHDGVMDGNDLDPVDPDITQPRTPKTSYAVINLLNLGFYYPRAINDSLQIFDGPYNYSRLWTNGTFQLIGYWPIFGNGDDPTLGTLSNAGQISDGEYGVWWGTGSQTGSLTLQYNDPNLTEYPDAGDQILSHPVTRSGFVPGQALGLGNIFDDNTGALTKSRNTLTGVIWNAHDGTQIPVGDPIVTTNVYGPLGLLSSTTTPGKVFDPFDVNSAMMVVGGTVTNPVVGDTGGWTIYGGVSSASLCTLGLPPNYTSSITPLPVGPGNKWSYAFSINNLPNPLIVGADKNPDSQSHAVMWVNTASGWKEKALGSWSLIDDKIPNLLGGCYKVNDRCEILALGDKPFATADHTVKAYFWQNGQVVNLDAMVGYRYKGIAPYDINNNGAMLAYGTIPNSTNTTVLLLLPVNLTLTQTEISPTETEITATITTTSSGGSVLVGDGSTVAWWIVPGRGTPATGSLSTSSSATSGGVTTVIVKHPEGATVNVAAALTDLVTDQLPSGVQVQGPTAQTKIKGQSLTIAELDDVTGPAFRRIALNGRAIGEPISGQKVETESEKEESYVDALTLRLHHSVTDIYVPIENSELSLSVRRNLDSEVWNERGGLRPSERRDRPFGAEWTSNLTPHIHFVYQQPNTADLNIEADYAYVTDEEGNQMRFVILGGPKSALGGGQYFVPLPSSKLEQANYLSTLTDNGNGTYTLTKERKTVLQFHLVPGLDQTLDMDRIDHHSGAVLHRYAAVDFVQDRLLYSLSYDYAAGDGLIPGTITASTGKSITIQTDGHGHVMHVVDPRGKQVDYTYADVQAVDGQNDEGKKLVVVTHPADIHGQQPTERYDYEAVEELDSRTVTATRTPWYHIDLTTITDGLGKSHIFTYTFDHSRQQFDDKNGDFATNGIPRNLTKVTLPDGIGETRFENHSHFRAIFDGYQVPNVQFQGYRSTYVADAAGHSRIYRFLDGQVQLLNNFKPYANNNVNPLYMPRQVAYGTMQVVEFSDHAVTIAEDPANYTMGFAGGTVLGSETVAYDIGAGLAVASYTDINGHTTSYSHKDAWKMADSYPWLNTYYPYGRYPEPTERVDALNHKKTYTYDVKWRLMLSVTDELLRKTQYFLGDQGQRTEEKVFDQTNTLIQDTTWDYDPQLHGFVTKHTVKKLPGSTLGWEVDLVTSYTPDDAGRMHSQIVDPDGLHLETIFGYDNNSNKTSAQDPKGFTTNFDYDNLNRLTKVTYPLVTGAAARAFKSFDYDLNSNKTVETDEIGHQSMFVYDGLNRLTKQVRDMNGNGTIDVGFDLITSYSYNAVNSRLTVTDPNGNQTTTDYDGFERPETVTQPPTPDSAAGYVTHFGYVGNSGPGPLEGSAFKATSITDDRGYVTSLTFDELYRLKKKTVAYDLQDATKLSTTDLDYDAVGNQNYEKDSRGHETRFVYDGLNRQVETDLAGGFSRKVQYSSTGLKSATIDENIHQTDYGYDHTGRLSTVKGPLVDDGTGTNTSVRPLTQNHYDNNSNLTSVDDPRLKTTSFEYDERNRKTKEIHPAVLNPATMLMESPTIQTGYDDAGNVRTIKDPRQNVTTTEYDDANRPKTVTYPAAPLFDGTSPQTTHKTDYDFNGNVLTVTDQNSHVTTNTYDALNRLWTTTVKPTDLASIVVTYGYDAANNRTSVEDGKHQITNFTYDGLNRNTSIKDPANKSTTFQYDGLVKTGRLDALGQQTSYDYDVRNRLQTVTYVGRAADNRTYGYDGVGNLLSVTQPAPNDVLANVAYTYDALNRVKTETSHGIQHTYDYDLAGNRTRVLFGQTNRLLINNYDDDNRLSSIADGVSTTGYVYDLSANLVSQTLPNGDTTITAFDALNRKQSIDTTTGAHLPLQHFDYGYDGGGNVRTIAESYANAGLNRSVTNTYDRIDRLKNETVTGSGACSTDYVYDDANNRTSKTVTGGPNAGVTNYVFDNTLNQLKSYTDPSSTTVTFGYDDNGNRTSSTAGNAVYSYDYENRLVGLTENAGANIYSYTYDYRSRRVERVENAASTEVIFSGGTSVQEYDGSTNALNVEYLRGSDWGGGVGGLLYSLRNGTPSFTHYDGRGDVTEKTSSAGVVTYQATYEAYGTRPSETGTTQDRQKANTKEEDPSGLLNEGMRYRDLAAGVFITRDPAGFVDGPNLYTYVNQNPWTKFDPEGLYEIDVHQYYTEWSARKAGFKPDAAKRLGRLAQGPDAVYRSGVGDTRDAQYEGLNYKNFELYHFVSAKRLIEMRDKVISEIKKGDDPMKSMGEYFHALEDTYAHSETKGDRDHALRKYYHDTLLGVDIGHGGHKHEPDWTWKDVPKSMKMAEEVYKQMCFFSQLMNQPGTPVPFSTLHPQVKKFMHHPTDLGVVYKAGVYPVETVTFEGYNEKIKILDPQFKMEEQYRGHYPTREHH